MHTAHRSVRLAPIVQWIKQLRPKEKLYVRIVVGAPNIYRHFCYNTCMAEKYFPDQFDDEEVLFVFRKHPVVMRKRLILALLLVLVGALGGLVGVYRGGGLGSYYLGLAIGLAVGVLSMLPAWISWHFSVFIVTDQRLIQVTQKGLFHRSVVDMGLNQIQMVNYQIAGLQETLLGFGTIMMQTFVGDLIIHDVHHPATIQKRLLEVLRDRDIPVNAYTNPKEEIVEENQA